jgi:hypothetical protein
MRIESTINANGTAISKMLVLVALAKSNLHWEMHHAMLYALESSTFVESTEIVSEMHNEEVARELLSRPQTNITLMGLPVIIDNEKMPKSLVRLMSGDVELSRIECLAVPSAFYDEYDYTDAG